MQRNSWEKVSDTEILHVLSDCSWWFIKRAWKVTKWIVISDFTSYTNYNSLCHVVKRGFWTQTYSQNHLHQSLWLIQFRHQWYSGVTNYGSSQITQLNDVETTVNRVLQKKGVSHKCVPKNKTQTGQNTISEKEILWPSGVTRKCGTFQFERWKGWRSEKEHEFVLTAVQLIIYRISKNYLPVLFVQWAELYERSEKEREFVLTAVQLIIYRISKNYLPVLFVQWAELYANFNIIHE